jgi:hypothetical protein
MQVPLVGTKATYAVLYVDGNTILSQDSFSVKAGAAARPGEFRVVLAGVHSATCAIRPHSR